MLICLGHKFKCAEHIAMVCDGNGGHVFFDGFFIQAWDGSCPVEQAKLGVNMQVGESAHSLYFQGAHGNTLNERTGLNTVLSAEPTANIELQIYVTNHNVSTGPFKPSIARLAMILLSLYVSLWLTAIIVKILGL